MTSGQPEEQLTSSPGDKIVPDWSRDGRYLVYIQIGTTTAEDIWALPLDGDRQPYPILQTQAIETNPALSPDGHWLAYESSQTGRPEVLVTRFPASRTAVDATAPRWQVSTQGGSRPRWSADGRALFYVALDDQSIIRADVRPSAAGFESDAAARALEIPVMPVARSPFDVSADGRLLLLERTINKGVPLAVVKNWIGAQIRHQRAAEKGRPDSGCVVQHPSGFYRRARRRCRIHALAPSAARGNAGRLSGWACGETTGHLALKERRS